MSVHRTAPRSGAYVLVAYLLAVLLWLSAMALVLWGFGP